MCNRDTVKNHDRLVIDALYGQERLDMLWICCNIAFEVATKPVRASNLSMKLRLDMLWQKWLCERALIERKSCNVNALLCLYYVTCLQMHVLIVLMHFRVEVKSKGNMRMFKACTKHDNKCTFYLFDAAWKIMNARHTFGIILLYQMFKSIH